MLADDVVREFLEKPLDRDEEADPIPVVLKKVVRCPICGELFTKKRELSYHLKKNHSDQLVSSGFKEISEHHVEEGNSRIYICPYCRYAVGADDHVQGKSPFTIIYNHVQTCRENTTSDRGPACVSFQESPDKSLINDYLRGCALIELFICPCPGCTQTFKTEKTLLRHLAKDHSSPSREDLSEEQKDHIRSIAKEVLDRLEELKASIRSFTVKSSYIEPTIPSVTTNELNTTTESDAHEESTKKRASPPAPVTPSIPKSTDSVVFTRTIKEQEIFGGYIVLPPRLSTMIGAKTRLAVRLARNEKTVELPYNSSSRRLLGLLKWFSKNAIEPGDKINFCLLQKEPDDIRIWTGWEKHLNYILRCPPEDFQWSEYSIRDCIIKVLSAHTNPLHYRSIYSQISRHREVMVGSVIATLSKHRNILFEHVDQGRWKYLRDGPQKFSEKQKPIHVIKVSSPPELDDEIWRIIAKIEKADAVYHLLRRIKESLSFNQICQKIAESMGIDWRKIQHTGFLNTEDKRIIRLDNGNFALRKWFDDTEKIEMPPHYPLELKEDKKRISPTADNACEADLLSSTNKSLFSKILSMVRRVLRFIFLRF